jgi:hypothetical protein
LIRDLRSAGKDDRKIEIDNRAAAGTIEQLATQIQKVSGPVQLIGAPATAANP